VPDELFGSRLRALRTRAGLTQEELAERAGLSTNAVSMLERGNRRRPYPHTIRSLVEALGLTDSERAELESSVPSRGALVRLPAAPTAVRGRDSQINAVTDLLIDERQRLVTLVGPGGVGKTRLGLAVAARLVGQIPDGVVFVDLADVADPAQVRSAIGEVLGLSELGSQPLREILHGFLRGRQMLLLLDNFEHLLAAAPQVAELLEEAPRLLVITTSRAPLRIRAERVVAVGPLDQATAVELFCERAEQIAGRPSPRDTATIEVICARLDNLPLAIELAAARTTALSPAQLLERLDPASSLPGIAPRDLPDRQRTLAHAVAWSYDLLDVSAQRLLRHCAVFAGGWTIDAAAVVGGLDSSGAIELHLALADSSLIERSPGPAPRFRMLETIRTTAGDYLREADEIGQAQDRHAIHYQQLGSSSLQSIWSAEQAVQLDTVRLEKDNLRVAWWRLLETGHIDELGDMCLGLMWWWLINGHLTDGSAWTTEALDAGLVLDAMTEAKLRLAAGTMLYPRGRLDEAAVQVDVATNLARTAGDEALLAWALTIQANLEAYRGRPEAAVAMANELDQLAGPASPLRMFSAIARAHVAIGSGDFDAANRVLSGVTTQARELETPWAIAVSLGTNGRVTAVLGDTVRAESMLIESLQIFVRLEDRWGLMHTLTHLADAAALRGDGARAAMLYGVGDQLVEQTGVSIFPAWQLRSDECQARAIEALGWDTFRDRRFEGRQLSREELVAELS